MTQTLKDQSGQRLRIAKIAKAHGIKGHVKLTMYTDDAAPLETEGAVYTHETGGDTLSLTLTGRTQKHLLAKIDGIDDRTAAEEIKGTELWIEKDALPQDDDSAFYISDLIGLKAVDDSGTDVGTVIAVDNFGAGDLLDIKPEKGDSFYLLFSDETVPAIDIENGTITVDIPDMI